MECRSPTWSLALFDNFISSLKGGCCMWGDIPIYHSTTNPLQKAAEVLPSYCLFEEGRSVMRMRPIKMSFSLLTGLMYWLHSLAQEGGTDKDADRIYWGSTEDLLIDWRTRAKLHREASEGWLMWSLKTSTWISPGWIYHRAGAGGKQELKLSKWSILTTYCTILMSNYS